jgi:hypothetical protein
VPDGKIVRFHPARVTPQGSISTRTDRSKRENALECADRIGATSLPGDLVAGPRDTVARGQGGEKLARTPGHLRRKTGQS